MEMYILDGLLRRNKVVDKFESLIWTERWHDAGDFELDLKSTLENRSLFLSGTHLAINNSTRVMTVEIVEDRTEDDGREVLKVKGRSLEAILEDRVAKSTMSNLAVDPTWVLVGTPGAIARTMFDHVCRPPLALSPNDGIPFLQAGSIFDPGTILESYEVITWEQDLDSLYNAIRNVCTLYDLGFRLVRNFDTSQLYFDVYSGNDRTTKQSVFSPVVFSAGLNNIENTTEFASIQQSKNVAYVFAEQGSLVVYGEGVDPTIDGFDRRVMVVNAQVEEGANVNEVLLQAGTEALLEHRAKTIFDGEVDQRAAYTYGVDYDLGDLVEMRNKDGVITYKRVSEQIFVADENGERSYPTLSLGDFTGQNTWLTWGNNNTAWEDMTDETWSDI